VPGPVRFAIQLARDRLRLVRIEDVYWLEAEGHTTLVRLRGARRLRDTRPLGRLLAKLPPSLFVRVHRNHAVNVDRVRELRRREGDADWELVLDPPVNRVLAVSRSAVASLRRRVRA
jgi:DNA-binding LytR/AlgR family response regulator